MGIMIFKGENLRYIFSMKKSSHNSYTIHRAGTQTKKTLRVKQAEVVLVPWVSLFALFLSLFILSCPPPANPPADDPPPPDVDQWVLDRTLEHEGITRYWDYYTPAGLGDNPPMLILLHGGTGSNKSNAGEHINSTWITRADQEKFVLVLPNGTDATTGLSGSDGDFN
jgi:hypothetical protein